MHTAVHVTHKAVLEGLWLITLKWRTSMTDRTIPAGRGGKSGASLSCELFQKRLHQRGRAKSFKLWNFHPRFTPIEWRYFRARIPLVSGLNVFAETEKSLDLLSRRWIHPQCCRFKFTLQSVPAIIFAAIIIDQVSALNIHAFRQILV